MRERIVQRVRKTDSCWLWTGAIDDKGYGSINHRGRKLKAHRASYEAFVGPLPAEIDGQRCCVLHQCDNPRCVNPEHLLLGTQGDNMLDKKLKGRAHGAHAGEAHHNAKLNAEKVLLIRAEPHRRREWAEMFGVSSRTILGIIKREIWRGVVDPKAA